MYTLIFIAVLAVIIFFAVWIWQMIFKDQIVKDKQIAVNKIYEELELVREKNAELKVDVSEQRKFIHKNQSIWSSVMRYFSRAKDKDELEEVNVEEIRRIWEEKDDELYEGSPLLRDYISKGILVVSEPLATYEKNNAGNWNLTDYKIFNEQLKNHYERAYRKHVEFIAEISSEAVKYLIDSSFITQIALQRLVGDLFKNSLEAIMPISDKGNILLKIFANENGVHEIVIYDSGSYFPKAILENIGKRGYTSKGVEHGNGLADVFETLTRCKASIVIDASKFIFDGVSYTKGIFVKFDMENSVEIV
jgi:signal transduction histidine kinase